MWGVKVGSDRERSVCVNGVVVNIRVWCRVWGFV